MSGDGSQLLLDAAVTARRTHNASHAGALVAAAAFYDARVAEFDLDSVPRPLDAERIAQSSVMNELAARFTTTAAIVESALNVWWGSRSAYLELFVEGRITFEVLRTIRDHTLGAPPNILALLEPDIITATRHFERTRLGREIDRMITAHDPDFDSRARKRASATTKKVRITALPRGMARMAAVIGARDAAELTALLDAECTHVCALDPRSLDTRRSEAFTALMRGGHLTCLCGYPDCVVAESNSGGGAANPDDSNPDDSSVADSSAADSNTAGHGGVPGNGGAGEGKSGAGDSRADADEEHAGSRDGSAAGSADSKGGSGDGSAGGGPAGGGAAGGGAAGGGGVPDSGRQPEGATSTPSVPLVHITADLETLLGLHNRSAYLHGYGPLDPDTIRALAADSTWQIIFTASRRYLDTLSDCDHCLDPDPPSDDPIEHTPQCPCTCGAPARADGGNSYDTFRTGRSEKIADLVDNAARESDDHARSMPVRMAAPTAEQRKDDRRRRDLITPNPNPNPDPRSPDPDRTLDGETSDTGAGRPDGTAGPNAPAGLNDAAGSNGTAGRDGADGAEGSGVLWYPDDVANAGGPEPTSTTPDLVLGRTAALPAGCVPSRGDQESTGPHPPAPPRPTPAALADHYLTLVIADPTHSHAEHPDGHGGHPMPPPGALSYTPGTALALWVRAHHPTCRHPGCNVPSSRCDLDHIVEFDHATRCAAAGPFAPIWRPSAAPITTSKQAGTGAPNFFPTTSSTSRTRSETTTSHHPNYERSDRVSVHCLRRLDLRPTGTSMMWR